jgi:hypothetical protein
MNLNIERKCKIYNEHNNAVKEYFVGRPDDLLVVCWEEGHGWSEICGFLGLPVPELPFPHKNAAGSS